MTAVTQGQASLLYEIERIKAAKLSALQISERMPSHHRQRTSLENINDVLEVLSPVAPEPWVNVRGCGWQHYTPKNIDAIIRDLKAVEQGSEMPEWVNRDHRARCGILWRVISAMSHELPFNPDPVESAGTGDAS